jgi:hypothetical protein
VMGARAVEAVWEVVEALSLAGLFCAGGMALPPVAGERPAEEPAGMPPGETPPLTPDC